MEISKSAQDTGRQAFARSLDNHLSTLQTLYLTLYQIFGIINTEKRRKRSKTRKGIKMKKTTMTAIYNYLSKNDIPELADAFADIKAEFAKNEAKAQANRELYAEAHDVVMEALGYDPITIADLYEKCADVLPEGFSKSKVQYAMREYWKDEVVKIENAKGANTYMKR